MVLRKVAAYRNVQLLKFYWYTVAFTSTVLAPLQPSISSSTHYQLNIVEHMSSGGTSDVTELQNITSTGGGGGAAEERSLQPIPKIATVLIELRKISNRFRQKTSQTPNLT